MIPVAYQADPFDFTPRTFAVEEGATLLDIVRQATSQPELFVVKLNGEVIPFQWWSRVRPRMPTNGIPTLITFHPKPSGDDAASIVGIVATIALVAAVAVIGGPLGAGIAGSLLGVAATSTTAIAVAAGTAAVIGVVGSLAISALTAPPVAGNIDADTGPQSRPVAGVGLNQISPGDYLPMVFGTMRASPPPLMPSYSTLEDGDLYVQGIIGLAGAYEIANIWLNGAPVEDFDDFEFDTRQGLPSDSAPSMNFTYSVQEIAPRLKFNQTKRDPNQADIPAISVLSTALADWHVFNLHPPGDDGKFIIRIFWPGGMNSVQPDNDVVQGGIGCRISIRPRSSEDWYELPELHFHQNAVHSGEVRQQIVLQWQAAVTTGTFVPDANDTAWMAFYSSAEGQTFARLAAAEYDPGGAAVLAKGVSVDDDGFYIEIDNTINDGDEEYDLRIKLGHSYTESSFTSGYLYGGSAVNGNQIFAYTGLKGTTPSKAVSPGEIAYIESVSSWQVAEPFVWQGLASIAFKAKGLQVDSLSAEFTSIVPLWDGASWSNMNPTNNPAALYRFACLSQDYNSQALPGEVLDEDNIIEWFEHCVEQEYECNAVIQNQSLPDVLQLVASTGWASPRYVDQWGVVMEKDRSAEDIIQMLTPLNSRDQGTVKEFPRLPHAIRAEYLSAVEENALRDDVVAFAPDFDENTATVYESIRYPGFTDPDKVLTRAQFDINQIYSRNIRYIRDVHNEGFVTPRGSLIGLVDDVVEHTHRYSMIVGVETSGGNVTGLRLESLVDLDTLAEDQSYADPSELSSSFSNDLAVTVRLNNGAPSTHLISEETPSDVVTFVTPVADTGQFEHGQIVAIGIAGREYKRVLVLGVEPHQGGSMLRLTLVDESPELHAVQT